jgi:transcriptional regulator with XRE-family HTH domain
VDLYATPGTQLVCYVPSLRETFGQRLKRVRLTRELSQEQFAELLGMSLDFLSLIEREINAPSFENLDAFSAQLNLPVSVLFDFSATLDPSSATRAISI